MSAIDMQDARSRIEEAIVQEERIYVSVCPVSTIMECCRDPQALTSVNSADLATPDGMPVVWLGRFKGHKNIKRVYGPDLLLEICGLSEKRGYRNYFYGSTSEVLAGLSENLQRMFPDLAIVGRYSPPFRILTEGEEKQIAENINKENPDVLWVGLGSPKQDIWMHRNRPRLNASIIIGVGAAFDFIAGTKRQAPKWMQRLGLEWFFRLIAEPGRLWKRYIIGNSLFMYMLTKEFAGSPGKFFAKGR